MKISIENLGIINHGEVNIEKLTVIAGENDTGKSTIGRSLFAIIKSLNEFDKSVYKYRAELIYELLRKIRRNVMAKNGKIEIFGTDFEIKSELEEILYDRNFFDRNFFEYEQIVLKKIEKLSEKFRGTENEVICEKIKELFKINKEEARKAFCQERFDVEFSKQFSNLYENEKSGKIKIYDHDFLEFEMEFNHNTIDKHNSYNEMISDVIYYETQNIFSKTTKRRMWDFKETGVVKNHSEDFFEKIFEDKEENVIEAILKKELLQKLKENIQELIGGTLFYDKANREIKLERNGFKISESNIASGIKNLGLFSSILNLSYLKNDNLIILDEPETALHPKWQVKYASFIVKLCKEFDVRILVASHSPYFIEALQKYSEKEELKGVNFYLMKKEEEKVFIENKNEKLEEIYNELGKGYEILDADILGDL